MKKLKTAPQLIKSVISKDGNNYKIEIFYPGCISPVITQHPEFNEIYKIALQYSERPDIQVNCERPNEHDALLETVPVEFRSVLSYMAYERGHSAGELEVLLILKDLIHDLKPAIEEFAKNHSIQL